MSTTNDEQSAPDAPGQTSEPGSRGYPPWVGPLVASAVIALVLVLLSLPSVLVYPRDRIITRAALPEANREEAVAALEARATELRKMLETGVCIANGQYLYRDPDSASALGLTPAGLQQTLLPGLRRGNPSPPSGESGDAGANAPPGEAPASAALESEASLLGHLDNTVAMVIAPTSPDEANTGSGFFIEPDLLLTNGHVVGNMAGKEVFVVSKAIGKLLKGTVEATTGTPQDGGAPDFALVRLDDGERREHVAPLSTDAQSLLRVVAAGYPGIINGQDEGYLRMMRGERGNLPTLSTWKGDVVTVLQGAHGPVVVHSAQIFHGNSGGPLVDLCGRVVGVNTYGLRVGDEATNNALGTGMLLEWLRTHGVTPQLSSGACDPEHVRFAQR